MTDTRLIAIDAIMNNSIVSTEFFRAMLGDLIGEGRDRYVFQSITNKNEVIKFDMSACNSNVLEWDCWLAVKNNPKISKWFAPVVKMSPCGRVLIMKKADMNRDREKYPKLLPDFFDDVKYNNFGYIGKQIVCVDYGINKMMITGHRKINMVKANW